MIIVYILIAILMFGLLIAVHELGHFVAAKAVGVKVNEFAIGMGPRIFHRQKGETEYTIRLFPIGGFCAMEGEEEDSGDPRAFGNRPAWQRLIVLAAGAFMNFVTGVVIFVILFSGTTSYVSPVIASFMDGFAAQGEDGLMAGDRIVEVDGHAIYLQEDISLFFNRAGEVMDITVVRDGERVELEDLSMPWLAMVDENGNPVLDGNGNQVLKRGINFTIKEANVFDRLRLAWYNSIDTIRLVWVSLGDLFTGTVGLRDMSGAVGIVTMMSDVGTQAQEAAQATGQNWVAAVASSIAYFVAFIAINLAVMNLLPIPALDGGQILFLIVDKIYNLFSKRHIPQKYLGYINAAGFIFLIGLMILVACSDVLKLFGK